MEVDNHKKVIRVTAAIFEQNGRIMAARRSPGKHLAGYWEFPGGKLEIGELPEECLKRELWEELGVEVDVGALFGTNLHQYESIHIELMAYWVSHRSGEFRPVDHDKILWLEADLLDSLKWAPADLPIVDKLIENGHNRLSIDSHD
ncbi:MAG: 8-oxo-dGTP diphosphatase MutT [Zetaproteobacteria bacterium]|nr:8-oxo-dGTP diphosphatase MutT [Pseudobdellovibrionaceae bacterium]